MTTGLSSSHVLLIGAGALGSPVAELLVRAGVTHMSLVDPDALVAGNLVRHTLTLNELGAAKATALADRLNAASPNATVTARVATAGELDAEYLGDCDVIVDATADHAVLECLEALRSPHLLTYVSIAITMHARRLVMFLARGTTFPVAAFDAAYEPFAHEERARGEERPMEGIGCWHPVFPARADEVWLMASAAVGLLNDAWPVAEDDRTLHMFERYTDLDGRFAGIRKVAP